jgi:hypothetical protein
MEFSENGKKKAGSPSILPNQWSIWVSNSVSAGQAALKGAQKIGQNRKIFNLKFFHFFASQM